MRTSGLGLAAVMIAVGAVLAWAVTAQAEGVDINQVGIIIFIVGLGLAAVSLLGPLMSRRTTIEASRESIVDGRPVVEHQREIITEQEAPPQA